MGLRLFSLREQLKNKERELQVLQNKARRMENEYRTVRYDLRLEWYGKSRKNKAQSRVRQTEQEIVRLKRIIATSEQKALSDE